MVSAQINLKDYYFYSFHLILIKLGIHDHSANAPQNCVPIRNLTPGVPRGALKEVNFVKINYFNNVIYVSALRSMGLLFIIL